MDVVFAAGFRFPRRRAVVLPTLPAWLRFGRHIGPDGAHVVGRHGIVIGSLNHGHPLRDVRVPPITESPFSGAHVD
jgi:hypothetical protein